LFLKYFILLYFIMNRLTLINDSGVLTTGFDTTVAVTQLKYPQGQTGQVLLSDGTGLLSLHTPPYGPQGATGHPGRDAVSFNTESTNSGLNTVPALGSQVTLTVGLDCPYTTGNSVVVTSQTNPLTNSFEGTVQSYNSVTGAMVIGDIVNIRGSNWNSLYNQKVNVNLDGINGATGAQGAIGLQGATGETGPTGAEGPQGVPGLDGINGINGATGPEGPQGVPGLDGINGINGATGPEGPQGVPGLDGINGINGINGATGPEGPQGVPGLDGINGINGVDGATGPEGPQGVPGLDGINGINGVDGATGPEGPQGVPGLDGINGINGVDGAQGPPGVLGLDGINGVDGATGPEGPQGVPGLDGINGINGVDGAQGPQGVPGLDGINGINGVDGATGPEGPQGVAGAQGADGVAGAQGATGPAGPQGLLLTLSSSGDTSLNTVIYNSADSSFYYSSSKTFVIDHPMDENKYLVHACLEGPEAGVYYRGKSEIINNEFATITLPEYVELLAHDFTIQVSPVYCGRKMEQLYFSEIVNNSFNVYGENCKFHWLVHGKRHDINVEPLKNQVNLNGDGPYRWIN
jgi:hypothetical protein